MTPTICTVSGKIITSNGAGFPGVVIIATLVRPFIYSSTGELIPNFIETTTTANDGSWSIPLVETTTDKVSITFAIQYATASGSSPQRYEYTAIIPNQSTANFSDIAVNINQ